ncbi:DUF6573 family protein [Solidesulfovibrio magneticus]|uniref:Uncharacterized protein n=1 Tax=Solidesulfovibrio magneticus (strain ATCC 700980 / DSM 13731 / RS-1) TaxID=573370 RepID=C4XKQ2_SOLM1|nr:DUF6573 family protein [Solidesulfovibrio magneticus]BAH74443.1 hypothetical protein DMR_09520 [Solidesulfovibrio magneticus RS-1]
MTTDNAFGNLIYSYTRAQAIADGVLIDVTDTAKTHGFNVHTVVTDNLYRQYVEVPSGLDRSYGQSRDGRLHDVLTLAMFAARASKGTDRVYFKVDSLMEPGRTETVQVIAHIGPGDNAEPVLTIMLPEDD